MKYLVVVFGVYSAAAAATYLDSTGWSLQARHTSAYLSRRGIVKGHRADQGRSTSGQSATPPSKQSSQNEQLHGSEQTKTGFATKQSSPKEASNNPRVSLETDGRAAMTLRHGSNAPDSYFHQSGSPHRRSGEHPTKMVGMIRVNQEDDNAQARNIRATGYGKGVTASAFVPPGGSGRVAIESEAGVHEQNVQPGRMQMLTASSSHPRGAKAIAKVEPPGLVQVNADNQRNFGDP